MSATDDSPQFLIGLDAASDRRRFGWSVSRVEGARARLLDAGLLSKTGAGLPTTLCEALADPGGALLAVDAPLGWPQRMAPVLSAHSAGAFIAETKDRLFRRVTDEVVRAQLRKQPLEVGADLIARAAVEALAVLDELRRASGKPLPLAWTPATARDAVIEVYPGATLSAHEMVRSGYKDPSNRAAREDLVVAFESRLSGLRERIAEPSDVFDACLCAICALDFLESRCVPPDAQQRVAAEREGWIWFAAPRAPDGRLTR